MPWEFRRPDVAAGDAGVDALDLAAGHQLGFLDGALDRLHRRLDVHHHALLQAAGGVRTDADHLEHAVLGHLADDGDDLGGADVETDDHLCSGACHGRPVTSVVELPEGRSAGGSCDLSRRRRVHGERTPGDGDAVVVARVDARDVAAARGQRRREHRRGASHARRVPIAAEHDLDPSRVRSDTSPAALRSSSATSSDGGRSTSATI